MSIHVKITYKQYLEFIDLVNARVDELYRRRKKYMKDYYVDEEFPHIVKMDRFIKRFEDLAHDLECLEISENE